MLDFSKARTHMVDSQIQTNGVVDPLLLQAFSTIPRELFVPEKLQGIAYQDDDLSIGQGRYLLEPAIHAKLVQAAKPVQEDVVLDIGSATGYSSAILSPLVTTVIAVESNKKQIDKAVRLWNKIGACNIVSIEASLAEGAPLHQPFSLIIVNGAVGAIPEALCAQLSPGGRLVTILKPAGEVMGRAVLVYRSENGQISVREMFDAAAPYLEGFAPTASFQF